MPYDHALAAPVAQRAAGCGRISFKPTMGGTGPASLYQQGCAQIRLPRRRELHAEAILINTAGGLTGGDRLEWEVEALAGAMAAVTTQACEKVYRSAGGAARVSTRLAVQAGAALAWIPQETILFNDSALTRTLEADVAADGRLLVLEAVVLGRQAMGETVTRAALRDRWRIRREGRLLFADDLALEGPVSEIAGRAAMLNGARAFASLLLVAPDADRHLDAARSTLGAASAWDGKLFARVTAADGFALRQALIPALKALAGPLPRIWTT